MVNFTNNTASLEAVLDKVNAANNEVATQTELISQIMTALEGKAAGGGSGSTLDTGTLTGATTMAVDPDEAKLYFDLENVTNYASKLLICLIADTYGAYIVLTRARTSDVFNVAIEMSKTTTSVVEGAVLIASNAYAGSMAYYAV